MEFYISKFESLNEKNNFIKIDLNKVEILNNNREESENGVVVLL